jgi:hypothetical protein
MMMIERLTREADEGRGVKSLAKGAILAQGVVGFERLHGGHSIPQTRKPTSPGGALGVIEQQLFELIDPDLQAGGARLEPGDDFRQPPLDVLRYYRRVVRWNFIPVLGKALSVVAVVRQPLDIGFSEAAYHQCLTRLARAVSGRFPPWNGLAIGLTSLIITPEPIGPDDDAVLGKVLQASLMRYRVVNCGLFRLNLGQEALALALKSSPDQLFTEPIRIADILTEHLRRFVPMMDMRG